MEKNVRNAAASSRRGVVFVQLVSTFLAFAVVASLAMLLSAAFFPAGSFISFVDGDSMLPTLKDGQILFTDHSPLQRGDFVIARMPERIGQDGLIVKRVIALPGDTVTINSEGVFVNNQRIEEPYLTEEAASSTFVSSHYNYMILGPDQYYLLGDNRASSLDSRLFGAVSEADLQYKQSVSPTQNTYLKLLALAVMLILCISLYCILDKGITKLLNKLLSLPHPAGHENQS